MSNIKAVTANKLFTGNSMLLQHAIVYSDDVITGIVPADELKNIKVKDYGNRILAPAFIDIQLYGAYGRLLSAYPDAETVKAIYDYSVKGGACLCMPTVATQTYDVIFACINAVKDYWQQGGKGVVGLHVEGPWISREKRGAHNADWIFSPSVEAATELLNYGKGVIKMITVAPEICSRQVIELIQSYGIIVSAGHSNATYEQATSAFDATIATATHLYNAMSGLQHRSPGMAGAIFNHPAVKCSLVPDGHHVSFAAIEIAKKIMGERLFAITDAVTETHTGYYQHVQGDDMYTSNGILSGSALTMQKALFKLVNYAHIQVEEALRMCSLYPAQVMQLKNFGTLTTGSYLNVIILDEDLSMHDIITVS